MCESAGVPFEPRHLSLTLGIRLGSLVERLWPLMQSSEPPITRFIAEQLGTAHWFDQRVVHNDLKWAPSVTLDEGFKQLTQWFASH
jgi:nucleoside-diphosphate-sugar epimerase